MTMTENKNDNSTMDTQQKDHFVVVPDESPASRYSWRVKKGPMTRDDAKAKAEGLKLRSDRRYRAMSGESLNMFPHLWSDDRDKEAR